MSREPQLQQLDQPSAPRHLSVGVIGHVDHGKTALVRALTGIETDRLKEEQERGMSIVLGFAYLATEDAVVDIIDVPGHERLVKTMISGATGIQALLLVIDSRELIKPQTIEHLAIASLLGVERGLTVLTKSDLIQPADRASAESQVRAFLTGTFLADGPVIYASSVDGEGIDTVRQSLAELAWTTPEPESGPFFFLPIDRAFSVRGFGAVVTGTLRYGPLRVEDRAEILPSGAAAGVRRLEVHSERTERAFPGRRTAVNLRGVEVTELAQGNALATPGWLTPTRRMIANIRLLPSSRGVRRAQEVAVYFGVDQVRARVYPFGGESLPAGGSGFVQLRLVSEVLVPLGERVILRCLSPAATIGGGEIIDTSADGCCRLDREGGAEAADVLRVLAVGAPEHKLAVMLKRSGYRGVAYERFRRDHRLFPEQMDAAVTLCSAHARAGLLVSRESIEALLRDAVRIVAAYHSSHRLRAGMPAEELCLSLSKNLPAAVFSLLMDHAAALGALVRAGALVRVPSHNPEERLTEVERRVTSEIAESFRAAGLSPPDVRDAIGYDRRKRSLCRFLVELGTLVEIADDNSATPMILHRESIADAAELLRTHLRRVSACSVSEAGRLLGIPRKRSVPLLQHLDRIGLTRRVGDQRVWNDECSHPPK